MLQKVWEKQIWLEYNVRKPSRMNTNVILKIIAIHTLGTTFCAREENNHGWENKDRVCNNDSV